MDRTRRSHAPVRYFRLKEAGLLDGGSPDLGLVRSCMRLRGWCYGALGRGADYFIWNKHAFAQRSGLRMHYVEEAMRKFRKTTTEFMIEEIRLGRSPRLKISFRAGSPVSQIEEIRRRLAAYIRMAARTNSTGVAKVDARFIEYFLATTKLPREIVGQVWMRLRFVPGCHCHWRGVGANVKLIAQLRPAGANGDGSAPAAPAGERSLQESSLPHGSPTGRRDKKKTMAPAAPGSPGRMSGASPPRIGPAASLRSPRSRSNAEQSPPARPSLKSGAWPQRTSERSDPRQALNGLPDAAASAQFADGNPLRQPFAVSGRWVSGAKIWNLSRWLAVEPLQAAHAAGARVRWRFAHAVNFAARALRAGHRIDALVAAYAAGVRRSHDDAGLARTNLHDGDAPREPSAAVNYAWRVLFQDTRPREERWAAIFAGERAPRRDRVHVPQDQHAENGAAGSARDRARRGKVEDLRALITPQQQRAQDIAGVPAITAGQLLEHLKTRGLTLAEFGQLPHAAKIRIVQSAIAQRPKPADDTK